MSSASMTTVAAATLLLLAACGDDAEQSPRLFEQSPSCPPNADQDPSLRLVGVVGGLEADVEQVGAWAGGGFSQLDGGLFQVGRLVDDMGTEQVGVELTWSDAILSGSARAATGGRLQLADSHPAGGQVLCVTGALVGIPESESSASLVFWITELRTGEDCSGNIVTTDLRGCWGSGSE